MRAGIFGGRVYVRPRSRTTWSPADEPPAGRSANVQQPPCRAATATASFESEADAESATPEEEDCCSAAPAAESESESESDAATSYAADADADTEGEGEGEAGVAAFAMPTLRSLWWRYGNRLDERK